MNALGERPGDRRRFFKPRQSTAGCKRYPDITAAPASAGVLRIDEDARERAAAAPQSTGLGCHPTNPPTETIARGYNVRLRAILHLHFDNDPSAGSPTETLLRLLLPLDDQV